MAIHTVEDSSKPRPIRFGRISHSAWQGGISLLVGACSSWGAGRRLPWGAGHLGWEGGRSRLLVFGSCIAFGSVRIHDAFQNGMFNLWVVVI